MNWLTTSTGRPRSPTERAPSSEAVLAAVDRLRPRHVHVASYFLRPQLAAALPGILDALAERGVTGPTAAPTGRPDAL